MVERRRHPRVSLNRPVRIKTSSGATVTASMVNISQDGAGVLYEAPAEVGARLELSFSLVVRGRQVEYRVAAVARYNHLTSRGYLIGFAFDGMDAAGAESLREFIAHKRGMRDV